jgi:hypothetical protein
MLLPGRKGRRNTKNPGLGQKARSNLKTKITLGKGRLNALGQTKEYEIDLNRIKDFDAIVRTNAIREHASTLVGTFRVG